MRARPPFRHSPVSGFSGREGFALLITVTLLAFVVILLIGLAAYTRIETAIAGNTQRQAQARENAVFALNVAVAQLQKYAGPDQRVTATAEAFGGGANTRRFTGVWPTDSSTDPDGDPLTPLTWLVSGNEALNADGTPVDPLAVAPGAVGASTIQLVGARTAGNGNTTEFISVPLQDIRSAGVPGVAATAAPAVVGRYGWWVGDQGVKAPVAVPDASSVVNYAPYDSVDLRNRIRQQIAQGAGATDASGNPVFEPRDTNNTALVAGQKITATSQLAFLKNSSNTAIGLSRVQQNFAAWSPTNLAVIADTAAGGLKQDLSLNPGLLGSAFAAWANYSAYTEPLQTTTTASNENGSTTTTAATEGIIPPYGDDPLRRRLIMTAPTIGGGVVHSVAPILSYFGMSFSIRESDSAAPNMEVAARCVIGLWNPYTSALVPQPLKVEVTGLPIINVIDNGTVPSPGDHRVLLQDVMNNSDPLLFSLPWVTDGGEADLGSWLPGRVHCWSAQENLSPADSPGIPMVAHAPDATPTGGGQGIVRQLAIHHHAAAPGATEPLVRWCEGAAPVNLKIRVLRAADDVELATYEARFPTFVSSPLPVGQKYVDFAFIARLPQGSELPTGESDSWLAAAKRDPRVPVFPASGFIGGANGDDPGTYGGGIAFKVRDPSRLLDRAGNSYTYNEDVPVFELPRSPLLSIGQLQHLQLVDARPFSVGNPWGAAVELNSTRAADLFDRFYFSGLVEGITPATTLTGDMIPPNPLLKPMRKSDGSRVSIDDVRALMTPSSTTDADGNTVTGSTSAHSSKFFLQAGAFNLNSTNVAAWIAVLRGVRFPTPQSFSYLDATEASGTAGDDAVATIESGDAHFFRFSQTAQETYKAEDGQSAPGEETTPPNTSIFRQGMRSLTPAEVVALAGKIVGLIKTKHAAVDGAGGPFRSVAEFLTPSALFAGVDSEGNAGAPRSVLEAAIMDAGINSNVAEFSSQFLTQADIMTALAPFLFARSDTFVVRAYGEAVNPMTSNTEGRAWCEAIVQRLPDYFNATADDASVAPAALSDPANLNQTYGRRFKVISFRWLTRSDI